MESRILSSGFLQDSGFSFEDSGFSLEDSGFLKLRILKAQDSEAEDSGFLEAQDSRSQDSLVKLTQSRNRDE